MLFVSWEQPEETLSVSDRSLDSLMLLKVPRKFLIFRWLQNCQGSGVSSILIGRSIKIKQLRRSFIFHIFQNYNLPASLGGKCRCRAVHPQLESRQNIAVSYAHRYGPSVDVRRPEQTQLTPIGGYSRDGNRATPL